MMLEQGWRRGDGDWKWGGRQGPTLRPDHVVKGLPFNVSSLGEKAVQTALGVGHRATLVQIGLPGVAVLWVPSFWGARFSKVVARLWDTVLCPSAF